MAFLINIPNRPIDKLVKRLAQMIPIDEIQVWPEVEDPSKIEFALVWNHQAGSLCDYVNLKGISSFGAGVDAILADNKLPQVPIARIVDPSLARNMAEYVLTQIQSHRLRLWQFETQQQASLWKPKSPRKAKTVGILGLGQLGQASAKLLNYFGYRVLGWSRSPKRLAGVESYDGRLGLKSMLPECDYLVCLLPLTSDTRGILNRSLLGSLPPHAMLINVARGEHLVEKDLLWALDHHKLDSACLDVFQHEPLEADHPFWQHDKIRITPHVSAVTDVETATKQIVENYQRIRRGELMLNTIDLDKGY